MEFAGMKQAAQQAAGKAVNLNTDDIQKLVLQTENDVTQNAQQQTTQQARQKVEVRNPIQHIIEGKDNDAKRDLLKDFIQKVANTGSDILTSPDRGKKDAATIKELKMIFGGQDLKEDQVSLSTQARMGQMAVAVTGRKSDRAKITEPGGDSGKDTADMLEELETHVYSEKTTIRDQVQRFQDPRESRPTQDNTQPRDVSSESGDFLQALGKGQPEKQEEEPQLNLTGKTGKTSTGLDASKRVQGTADEGGKGDQGGRGDQRGNLPTEPARTTRTMDITQLIADRRTDEEQPTPSKVAVDIQRDIKTGEKEPVVTDKEGKATKASTGLDASKRVPGTADEGEKGDGDRDDQRGNLPTEPAKPATIKPTTISPESLRQDDPMSEPAEQVTQSKLAGDIQRDVKPGEKEPGVTDKEGKATKASTGLDASKRVLGTADDGGKDDGDRGDQRGNLPGETTKTVTTKTTTDVAQAADDRKTVDTAEQTIPSKVIIDLKKDTLEKEPGVTDKEGKATKTSTGLDASKRVQGTSDEGGKGDQDSRGDQRGNTQRGQTVVTTISTSDDQRRTDNRDTISSERGTEEKITANMQRDAKEGEKELEGPDKESKTTGLNNNQRLQGLSHGGSGDQGQGERQREDDSREDVRAESNKKLVSQMRAKHEVEEQDEHHAEVNREGKTKITDEKDAIKKDGADREKKDDNEIEQESGGRIQMGGTGSQSGEGGGQKDQQSQDDLKVRRVKETEDVEEPPTKTEALTDYTEALRQMMLSPKKDMVKLNEMQQELQKQFGLTSRQIKDIEMAVKKNIKIEIRDTIKDAILQKQLTLLNKFDAATSDARMNKFTEYFVNNLLLGHEDFGNFDEGFQGLINKAMYFAGKDLADFAIDELGGFVTSESLLQGKSKEDKVKDFEKKINDLNSITNNPKITEEWAQTAMEALMKNLGITKENVDFSKQVSVGLNVNVNTGDSGFNQQDRPKEQHGYEFDSKDEKDILINRLRALYLQRSLNPGLGTTLQTEFKIRKLKNGLIKMGVFTDVLNEKIQKEVEVIAKDRTMDMLKEALQERSTLYELRGPAYDLVENKIKGILKNAEKVDIKIDKREFDKLRDESNLKMFEITRKEMDMIGVRLADADLPALVVRQREMKKLLNRLKEESNIDEEIGGDERLNMTVVETA